MKKQLIPVAVFVSMFTACKNEPAPMVENQVVLSEILQQEEGGGLPPQGLFKNGRATASVRINGDPCGVFPNLDNCVFYCRCRRSLPRIDLTFFEVYDRKGRLVGGKRFIINSSTPSTGAAAIIRTSAAWGHLAIVQRVSGSILTIRESNFAGAFISERSGTAADLNIVGYHR